jgi:hypothetical protein
MPVLKPHKVIAEFRHASEYIKPGAIWTPITEASRAKLVAAGCIRPLTTADEVSPKPPTPEPEATPESEAAEPELAASSAKKKRGRRSS